MNELDPNIFIRTRTDEVGNGVYKLHLQYIDEVDPKNAMKIAKQAGGVQSLAQGEQYFVKFATADLPTLCKDIERIGSELESMGSSVL